MRLRGFRILGTPSARFAGPRLRIPLDRGLAASYRRAGTHASACALFSSVVSQTVDGLRPGMFGRVAEWLKAHDWKSCGLTPTWVRIPPRPLAGRARHRTAWASNPGLSLRALRVLGSPSAPLSRRLGCESHPVRLRAEFGSGRAWAVEPGVEVADAAPPRLAIGPASRGLGCASRPVVAAGPSRGSGHLAGERVGRQLCASPPVGGNDFRGVAQSGRALRSGRRGPRFKSGRPDFDSRLRGFRPQADRPGFVRRRSLIGKAPHSKCGGRKPLGVRVPPPPLPFRCPTPEPAAEPDPAVSFDLVFLDGADAGRCSLAGI